MKPLWHRPRIVTVEDIGPFGAFKLFTLIDGRTIIVPQTPTVVNSSDTEKQVRKRELDRRYKADQRQRDAEAKNEAKQYNKKHKHRHKQPEPVRAVKVWLTKSEREETLRDVELERPIGRPFTRSEMREIESRVTTARVRSTLRK